jgi:hypothetical protein
MTRKRTDESRRLLVRAAAAALVGLALAALALAERLSKMPVEPAPAATPTAKPVAPVEGEPRT